MLNARKFSGSAFLTVEDLRTGPRIETIEHVAVGEKYSDKLTVTFRSGMKLGLNKTAVKTLINWYGDDADQWHGHEVKVSLGTTDYRGQDVDTHVVEPISPAISTAVRAEMAKKLDAAAATDEDNFGQE